MTYREKVTRANIKNIKLRPVKPTERDMRKTFDTLNPMISYRQKCYCSECGTYFGEKKDLIEGEHNYWLNHKTYDKLNIQRCPHCHKKITGWHIGKDHDYYMMLIIQTHGEYHIFRRFLIERVVKPSQKAQYRIFGEVSQMWIGQKNIISLERRLTMYPDSAKQPYSYEPDMKCKNRLRYDGYMHHRILKHSPELDNIWDIYHNHKMDLYEYKNKLYHSDPMFETLYKKGEIELFKSVTIEDMKRYKHCIRIALKNKFVIEKWYDYRDYLKDLDYLNLDTHSPHYLCPNDFMQQHNLLSRRVTRLKRIEQQREQKNQAIKHEDDFIKSRRKYFPIKLQTKNNLIIRPIMSITEMFEEGIEMNHCVGGYWNRKDSLILVCRTEQNKRVATIELNLITFAIIQVRGFANSKCEYENEIKDTIKDNLIYFQDPRKRRKKFGTYKVA